MKRALATFLAATAVAGASAPALAQDGHVLPPPPPPVTAYPQVDYVPAPPLPAAQAAPVAVYHDGASVHPAPMPGARYQAATSYYEDRPYYEDAPYHEDAPGLPPLPSLGYTLDEREAWLADCRATYYGEGKKTGGIIGGLLGAIGGGIIGHEVTGGSRTRRIGGTLIGAGVGGLAGLAIGAAIGAASDKGERIDECEAYLRRYLAGPGYGHEYGRGYHYGYQGYTTVMVPVQVRSAYTYSAPIRRENEYIVEEVVEERVVVPQQAPKYVKTAPAPATKYAKTAPQAK